MCNDAFFFIAKTENNPRTGKMWMTIILQAASFTESLLTTGQPQMDTSPLRFPVNFAVGRGKACFPSFVPFLTEWPDPFLHFWDVFLFLVLGIKEVKRCVRFCKPYAFPRAKNKRRKSWSLFSSTTPFAIFTPLRKRRYRSVGKAYGNSRHHSNSYGVARSCYTIWEPQTIPMKLHAISRKWISTGSGLQLLAFFLYILKTIFRR